MMSRTLWGIPLEFDIGQSIRTLCARKGIEIIEAAALPHLYTAIPPKYSVSNY